MKGELIFGLYVRNGYENGYRIVFIFYEDKEDYRFF